MYAGSALKFAVQHHKKDLRARIPVQTAILLSLHVNRNGSIYMMMTSENCLHGQPAKRQRAFRQTAFSSTGVSNLVLYKMDIRIDCHHMHQQWGSHVEPTCTHTHMHIQGRVEELRQVKEAQ